MEAGHLLYPPTAAEYGEWVRQLSYLSPRETLFTGNFKRLAKFLYDAQTSGTKDQEASGFVRLYVMNPGAGGHEVALASDTNTDRGNRILYLSGYPSTSKLVEIGSKYQINPGFFDRHLSFVGDDSTTCRIHPSQHILPSRQQLVLQLSIPSIGGVHGEWIQEDMHKRHQASAEKMRVYTHDLRMGKGWRPLSSIVRSSEIHDVLRFSIEQFVTIHISRNEPDSDKWTIAIWSDAGEDLSISPGGPWPKNAHFQPVTLYVPEQLGFMASIAYGLSLDPAEMSQNPIYALDELFRFYSAAEMQYLDMIAAVLDASIADDHHNTTPERLSSTRTILLHSHRMLQRRQGQITSMLAFLHFPAVANQANASPRAKTALSTLRVDLEYLQHSNQELMSRCTHELDIMTNEAMFEDARRGIVLSRNSQKFAAFAAFYVPLSFTCSVFGMNFVTIEDIGKGFQMWVLVSIPVFLLSLVILFWNPNYVGKIWRGTWLRTKGGLHTDDTQ